MMGLLIPESDGQPSRIQFEHIQEGLTHSNAICMTQDKYGFLWVGTLRGLNRYDGYTFEQYKYDAADSSTIGSDWVTSLLEDENGNMWVGTYGGGVSRYDWSTDTFTRFMHDDSPSSLSGDNVTCLYQDGKGNIWVGTTTGLNRFVGEEKGFERFDQQTINMVNDDIQCLFEDKAGQLWFATPQQGLGIFKIDPEKKVVEEYRDDKYGDIGVVKSAAKASDGSVWLGTEKKGLYNMTLDGGNNPVFEYHDLEGLSNFLILALKEDKDGNLWIGTENGGLFWLSPEGLTAHFTAREAVTISLNDNSIWSICETESGGLWFGTYNGGINKYDKYRYKFEHIQKQVFTSSSLSNNAVNAIAEEDDSIFWIGTDGGGLNLFDTKKDKFQVFSKDKSNSNSLSSDAIIGITPSKYSNRLFIATWEGGVSIMPNRKKPSNNFEKYNPTASYFDVLEDRQDSTLWLAAWGGGVEHRNADFSGIKAFQYLSDDGEEGKEISSGNIFCLLQTHQNWIWAGTLNGLNIGRKDENGELKFQQYFHSVGDESSLKGNAVLCMYEDQNNQTWIGTNQGLCRYNEATDDFTSVKGELGEGAINSIVQDDSLGFWIASSQKLFYCSENMEIKEVYTQSDGLQSGDFKNNSVAKAADGRLLFGGSDGLNMFSPNNINKNPYPPKVYLTDLKVFNKSIDPKAENSPLSQEMILANTIELNHDQKVFSIEYVGIGYTHPEQNEYAFRLEGLEEEWNYVGSQRFASYSSLPPKTYTFMVKAANNDGKWCEPYSIKLVVIPPWWDTIIAKTIFWLVAIIAVVGFYRWRTNVLERQKRILELRVEERTQKLQMANHNLNEQKHEILSQNEELTQQAEEIAAQRDQLQTQHKVLEESYSIIHETNTKLTDSIRYAQTIQDAILPQSSRLKSLFEECFIIYRPKDIVSGDFYWFLEIEEEGKKYYYLAVVDCTGHGVPGAFMSMIGSRILNELVLEKRKRLPSEILSYLNKSIRVALKQDVDDREANTDGMDLGVLRLQFEEDQVNAIFAGAKNTMWLHPHNQELAEIRGDKIHIGGLKNKGDKSFVDHEFTLKKGDVIYLLTDGMPDQNNEERKKLGTPELKDWLEETRSLPMEQQGEELVARLSAYQKTAAQRDDITMLGIRPI